MLLPGRTGECGKVEPEMLLHGLRREGLTRSGVISCLRVTGSFCLRRGCQPPAGCTQPACCQAGAEARVGSEREVFPGKRMPLTQQGPAIDLSYTDE